jgi:hypothetical protein
MLDLNYVRENIDKVREAPTQQRSTISHAPTKSVAVLLPNPIN